MIHKGSYMARYANAVFKTEGHFMNNYGQKYSFGARTQFKIPDRTFGQLKRITRAVLSISENLRYMKGQIHHMTKYGQN